MEQNDLSLSRPSTLHYSSEIHPYVSEFLHFLQSRYKYTSYGTEIENLNECCQSDLPQLKLINEKLKTEAATRRLIEKYSIEKITDLIDEITAKVK